MPFFSFILTPIPDCLSVIKCTDAFLFGSFKRSVALCLFLVFTDGKIPWDAFLGAKMLCWLILLFFAALSAREPYLLLDPIFLFVLMKSISDALTLNLMDSLS